jgi:hypothetical protein
MTTGVTSDNMATTTHVSPNSKPESAQVNSRNMPDDAHRRSCLDHVYVAGTPAVSVELLDDASTDHRPLVLRIAAGNTCTSATRQVIKRRNFKKLTSTQLELALAGVADWSSVHAVRDVEEIHSFIVKGIVAALDVAAPYEEIKVKQGAPLYLSPETLTRMRERDEARSKRLPSYKRLRNACNVMVASDKRRSNTDMLAKAGDSPKVLWQLADAALGKNRPPSRSH